MNVIYKMRNILIQKWQHFAECQLISATTHRTLLIQYESTVIVIQTTITYLFCILKTFSQIIV
jgi:hypothetical protein